MATFTYKIRDSSGHVQEGTTEGTDKYAVARDFTMHGSTVILVEEMVKKSRFNVEAINIAMTRVKMQDKIMFARNLAAMIDAGLPLARALSVLEKQTKNIRFKKIIQAVSDEITKGTALSAALGKHTKEFSALFVSMVRAGEESGSLSETLRLVSEQLDKSYQLKKKIRGAMIYPTIVIIAMFIIGILMSIFVVPTLVTTFQSVHASLPATTQVVIFISNSIIHYPVFFFGAIILLIVGFLTMLRTQKGRRMFEKIILRLPVIKELVKQSNAASTSRTLSSLLASGVDMVAAIDITKDVIQNSHYKEVLASARKTVEKGIPLSKSFVERSDLYPVLVGEMIEVGEETGKLSDMLHNTAAFYESEVDEATKNLSTIVEPILMIVIGAFVGFFAVSMLTPIYSVMNNV